MNEFLLVEVTGGPEGSNEMEAFLLSLPQVVSVSVHGGGCCCGNCPWKGDHG